MADILLDSDVIIAWLRGYDPLVQLIPELLNRGDVLAWTPISVAEIFAGIRKTEEKQVENLFLVLEPISLSADVGKIAGRYMNSYSRSHGIQLGDAMVAAAARFYGIPLWTLNRKHYPMRDIRFWI